MDHELEFQVEPEESTISGNWIVDIDYSIIWKEQWLLNKHNANICTGGILELKQEIRKGLVITFIYKCNVCGDEVSISSENPNKPILNKAAVWATLSVGSTYKHTEEFLSVLEIPPMSERMFYKLQSELGELWQDELIKNMEEAGKEEHDIAKNLGHIDEDGILHITVNLDGGWSKRSYGHTYKASSGVVSIWL